MANINIKTLKPQSASLKIFHPVITNDIVVDGIDDIKKEDYPAESQFEYNYTNNTTTVKQPVYEFELPDGTFGPLEFYLVGRNSKQWFDFMKKLKGSAGSKQAEDLFNIISEQAPEFMASLIVGWLDNGAIDTKYSHDEAVSLLSNPENIWILEQVQKFAVQDRHFFSMT